MITATQEENKPKCNSIDFWTRDGKFISLSQCTNCGGFVLDCNDHHEGQKFTDDIFLCKGCMHCNEIRNGTPVEEVQAILASKKRN